MTVGGRGYDLLFSRLFTRIDPERAHDLSFAAIRAAGPVLSRRRLPGRPVEALGRVFPNAVGLAAGFDKNGVGIDALAGLGFGHVEIGTVTGEPQPGNPRPRLFRLVADRAVVNRMGFNNDGAEAVADRLGRRGARLHESQGRQSNQRFPSGTPHGKRRLGTIPWGSVGPGPILGINIGKTKVVPDEDQAAVEADYAKSTRLLAPYADYLVVNVSSPNTPGLRNLQAVEKLGPLLAHVRSVADTTVADRRVPLLVKIAPDLADADVLAVADLALELGLDGIVATNTTISREGLRSPFEQVEACGSGGLSGAPVRARAAEVLRLLRQRVGPDLTLIGVGGISTPEDAAERIAAGATLVQAYTGFVYGGPAWPRRIAEGAVLR